MIFRGCPPEFGVGVPLGVMPAGEALMVTCDVGVAPRQLSKDGEDAQKALMRSCEALNTEEVYSINPLDVVQRRVAAQRE